MKNNGSYSALIFGIILLIVIPYWCVTNEMKDLIKSNKFYNVEVTDSLYNSTPDALNNFVYVNGGTFRMGCNKDLSKNCYKEEQPIHTVSVNSFWISRFEVTNEQYASFLTAFFKTNKKMNELKYLKKCLDYPLVRFQKRNGESKCMEGQDKLPVTNVTWYGANEYAKFYNLRLPTEAEWEFAARGGNFSHNYEYSGSRNFNEVGSSNFDDTVVGWKIFPVGRKKPNELGIYDMSGNVAEWCNDWYEEDYYQKSNNASNPTGPTIGNWKKWKVLRGRNSHFEQRISARGAQSKNFTEYFIGFRVVKTQ